jgi:malate dehydrogenase
VFIGGFPRKQGMERKELLAINGKIFKAQGTALNSVAKPTAKILVVANPANTNCLILQSCCPNIPKENFSCLTRLDHNRALSQLAIRSGVHVSKVKNAIIWGNHSSTQYPDVNHGTIDGKPIREVIKDDVYLNEDFISRVQKRGAEIIAARKGSSVFSAANAVKDHLRDWYLGSNDWVSMGIISTGAYDVSKDLCFSFPIRCKGHWQYEVVEGLALDQFSKTKISETEKELKEEKEEAFSQ